MSIACQKEENFTNATEFLPERWINDDGRFDMNLNKSSSLLVAPFGKGKRQCPAARYAENLLILLTLKLVSAFEIEVLNEMEKVFDFIVRTKTPIDIMFRDREN